MNSFAVDVPCRTARIVLAVVEVRGDSADTGAAGPPDGSRVMDGGFRSRSALAADTMSMQARIDGTGNRRRRKGQADNTLAMVENDVLFTFSSEYDRSLYDSQILPGVEQSKLERHGSRH